MGKSGSMSGQLDICFTLGHAEFWSDVPPLEWHLVAKSGTKLFPIDLSSDISLKLRHSSGQE